MFGRLSGKRAVITGGASGIGLAIAEKFLRENAELVVIADNDEDALRLAPGRLRRYSRRALERVACYPLDVGNATLIDEFAKTVVAEHGNIEVLVNNAGITRDKTFRKKDLTQFFAVFDVNFAGPVRLIRAALDQRMLVPGSVILNASSAVAPGHFGQSDYAATKSALESLTRTLAAELGKDGIRVVAVAPGFIDTAMTQKIPPERIAAIAARIPLGRFGTPEEVANVYAFLASDEAKYMTGTVVEVSGGLRV